MNKLEFWFYSGRLWTFLLRLTGRVPAGFYLGRWMTLKDAQACVGPGWAGLVKEGFDLCLRRGARIHQIKEKFGGLRFYCDFEWGLEESKLEERSLSICEECGRPGKPRGGGWIKTLCDSCADARFRRRERSWQ